MGLNPALQVSKDEEERKNEWMRIGMGMGIFRFLGSWKLRSATPRPHARPKFRGEDG